MRLAVPICKSLRNICLLSLSMIASYSGMSYAQVSEQPSPPVNITMYLVKQTTACGPLGYGSKCIGWTEQQIDDLLQGRIGDVIDRKTNVLPGDVILGETFFNNVKSYSGRNPNTRSLQDRRAVLVVFEWKEPQGTTKKPVPITLTRNSPSPEVMDNTRDKKTNKPCKVSEDCIVSKAELRGYRVWLDHERADAFNPSYGVKWTLEAGQHKWSYRTQK